MNSYYKILEIDENCSMEDVKHAYRRLAKKYHPDINKSPDAQKKFIEISEAYEILLNQFQNEVRTAKSESFQQAEYEEFIRKVREQAKKQANMRYRKFASEHEAFRESGLQDLVLLLKYFGRIIEPILGFILVAFPISISLLEKSIFPFLFLFFFWVIGGTLLLDSFLKRKGYFKLGGFYYNFNKIIAFYKYTANNKGENCFYCAGKKADSYPYNIHLLKVGNIMLRNRGPLQHHAGYERENYDIKMPRSRKAFMVHSITSTLKILAILAGLFLLPFESYAWRFIISALIGFLLSSLVLFITQTHSKNAYLLSYGILIKIAFWIFVIILFSKFSFHPLNISTNPYIRFVLFWMVFLDSILEQILKIPKKQLFKPMLSRYERLNSFMDQNYQLYLEIPGWTVIYPIARWIF